MAGTTLPLFIGFIVMSIASIALYVHGDKRVEYRHHTQFHAMVPFIAATAYLAMTMGTGVFNLGGVTHYIPRYLDWSVTTPILLTGLILTGLHEHPRHSTYVLPAIVLDVLMIVTGLLSALAELPMLKWIWFAWSCAAFAGIFYVVWGPVKRIGDRLGGRLEGAYTGNLVFLSATWLLYPVVFAIGPEGAGVVGGVASVWLILALDITAKVIYGYVATRRFKAMPADIGTDDRRMA